MEKYFEKLFVAIISLLKDVKFYLYVIHAEKLLVLVLFEA